MRVLFFSLVAGMLSSVQIFAQDGISDWYPTRVGDTWLYAYETRDAGGEGPTGIAAHQWKTEETVVGAWAIPEGRLIGLRVRVIEGAPHRGYHVDTDPAFFIRGNCLYKLGAHDWDRSTHELSAEYRKWLAAGEYSPDLCFPMALRKTWGAPHWGGVRPAAEAQDWKVAGIKKNTVHIMSVSSYLGSGMTAELWFEKGVGVVREVEIHHGTLGERQTHLLRFRPATSTVVAVTKAP